MAEMTSSTSFVECGECGALVSNWSKHSEWHEQLAKLLERVRFSAGGF